jgi:hypothetical protein
MSLNSPSSINGTGAEAVVESCLTPINVLVEGVTDEAIVRRLLDHVGLPCGTVYGKTGKDTLLNLLPRYNRAARFFPWLVVVDLDRDADCALPYVARLLPGPAEGMCLRVAVRSVEAWLLADVERFAAFLSIPPSRIPLDPDALPDPKAALIDLARRSRRRAIREDVVPREGSGARVGPGYVGRIIEFVTAPERSWRPEVAAQRSDSLRRSIEALRKLRAAEHVPA